MKQKVANAIDRIERHREWNRDPGFATASPYMFGNGSRQWDKDLDTIIEAARKS